jgi:hypothetical protein
VFGFLEGIGCANSKERKKGREGIWVLFLGKEEEGGLGVAAAWVGWGGERQRKEER